MCAQESVLASKSQISEKALVDLLINAKLINCQMWFIVEEAGQFARFRCKSDV